MSYFRPKEALFSEFWNKLAFGMLNPTITGIKFKNIEYTDEDDDYNGICSVFQRSNEGVYPTYNVPFPVGIPNIGNTCYMNALIQSLIACDELEKYIEIFKTHMVKLGDKFDSAYESGASTADSDSDSDYFTLENSTCDEHYILKSFIDAYTALKRGDTDLDKITQFYDHLCDKFTYIFEQEDAHELLMVIFGFFNDYAKKQTLYAPRLEYMKELKNMIKSRNTVLKGSKSMAIKPQSKNLGDSTSTMSSSFKSDLKFNHNQALKNSLSSGSKLDNTAMNSNIRSTFEGLTNPFTSILTSKFTCLECGDYSWEKHELRYVLTVPVKGSTLEENIIKDMKCEIIEDYQCIKCTIKDTLRRIQALKSHYGDSLPRIKELVLLEQEVILTNYANSDVIDEDEFEQKFRHFSIQKHNMSHMIKLSKPRCRITREHQLAKAPRILCVHLNRLADYDPFGNLRKEHKFIKFPYVLDLSKCFGTHFKHKYELKSLVEHLGGANSGHFVTMRKLNWGSGDVEEVKIEKQYKTAEKPIYEQVIMDITGQSDEVEVEGNPGVWVLANDSEITFISIQQVLRTDAYMLFYERIEE